MRKSRSAIGEATAASPSSPGDGAAVLQYVFLKYGSPCYWLTAQMSKEAVADLGHAVVGAGLAPIE